MKNAGLLDGGFLKKTKVDFDKIDKSTFKAIDKRNVGQIDLGSAKEAKVMTPQPEGSYRIDKAGNSLILTITDRDKFWGVYDFAIIQID